MTFDTVVTDIDGTLAHDHHINDDDRRALEDVISSGIRVMAATTRMRHSASVILKDTGITREPGMCLNGAHITGPGWDTPGCQVLYRRELDRDIARGIAAHGDEMGYEITTIYRERKYWKIRRDRGSDLSFEDPVAVMVEKNIHGITEEECPTSFMMHAEKNCREGMEEMLDYVAENFPSRTVTHKHHRLGEWAAITIYPGDVNKGDALERMENMGLLDVKKVVAIGNDLVDMPMLEVAGLGVAMEDSPQEVKEVADAVVPSCLGGGFSRALREYVL